MEVMSKFHRSDNPFVDHVHLYVSDLEQSLAYYEEIIGLRSLSNNEHVVQLTADGKRPLVTLERPAELAPKRERSAGLYHFALLLPERKDLAAFLQHLLDREIYFGASDHKVSEAIYLRDPDGNAIEVYCDRDDQSWGWIDGEVKMSTDPLDTNNLLAEKRYDWSGVPEKTLLGHIHLHVSYLEDTEAFYRDILGFKLMTRYPGALFMATGGYHHHIGLNIWNGEGAPLATRESVGLFEYKIVYNENDLQTVVNNARDKNHSVKKTESGFIIHDPSNNRIRLQATT